MTDRGLDSMSKSEANSSPKTGSTVSTGPQEKMMEKVLSGLEVEALLKLGSEHLFLLFTQSRLILAHRAKLGRGSVPLYSLFGKMAEGFKKTREKDGSLQRMAAMEPDSILKLHRDNFSVEYPRVVSVQVEPTGRRTRITLITSDKKYELYASAIAVEGVREDLKSFLGNRVEYRTTG